MGWTKSWAPKFGPSSWVLRVEIWSFFHIQPGTNMRLKQPGRRKTQIGIRISRCWSTPASQLLMISEVHDWGKPESSPIDWVVSNLSLKPLDASIDTSPCCRSYTVPTRCIINNISYLNYLVDPFFANYHAQKIPKGNEHHISYNHIRY